MVNGYPVFFSGSKRNKSKISGDHIGNQMMHFKKVGNSLSYFLQPQRSLLPPFLFFVALQGYLVHRVLI